MTVSPTSAPSEGDVSEPSDSKAAPRRPWVARHRVLTTVIVVVVGIAGIACWAAKQAITLADDLRTLQAGVETLSADVSSGDISAALTQLTAVRKAAVAARASADAPAVQLATQFPWLGPNITAIRTVTIVADDLTATVAEAGPLAQRVASSDRLDPAVLNDALELLATLGDASGDATARLDAIDHNALDARLASQVTTLRSLVGELPAASEKVRLQLGPLVRALQIVTAPGSGRHWLAVMQNLGEARPSGGLLSAWALLRTGDGTIESVRQGSNDSLARSDSVSYQDVMPAGYQDLWGNYLGAWLSMNLSANFPDNARLIVNGWNALGDQQLDGVITFGQGTVSYLAAASGPVTVAGRTIQPADLADYLTVGIYSDFPDPKKKDEALAGIIAQVFDGLTHRKPDLASLMKVTLASDSADYVQLWSPKAATERQIRQAGLSGVFDDSPGPSTTVRLINGGANKVDAFMHLDVDYRLGACTVDAGSAESSRSSTLTVTLSNKAPAGLPSYMAGRGDLVDDGVKPKNIVPGSNRDYVAIYAPAHATITGATQDEKDAFVQEAWIGDRDMLVFDVQLLPGQSSTLRLMWEEPAQDDQGRQLPTTPTVVLPPLANPATVTLHPADGCQ